MANQAVQPTGTSRLAQRQIERHRRLAPVADLVVGHADIVRHRRKLLMLAAAILFVAIAITLVRPRGPTVSVGVGTAQAEGSDRGVTLFVTNNSRCDIVLQSPLVLLHFYQNPNEGGPRRHVLWGGLSATTNLAPGAVTTLSVEPDVAWKNVSFEFYFRWPAPPLERALSVTLGKLARSAGLDKNRSPDFLWRWGLMDGQRRRRVQHFWMPKTLPRTPDSGSVSQSDASGPAPLS